MGVETREIAAALVDSNVRLLTWELQGTTFKITWCINCAWLDALERHNQINAGFGLYVMHFVIDYDLSTLKRFCFYILKKHGHLMGFTCL